MKQLLQNLKTGKMEVAELPSLAVKPRHLLIATRRSLISSGTERSLMEFASSSLIDKARKNPERVHRALEKARTDGLWTTFQSVRARLDQAVPLGYCNVGTVLETGPGVAGYRVGQRVASNGHHAELVNVPAHLCAAVPDEVDDEAAAFTVLAAVALQGLRLAQPTLGEKFVVSGLGLVGLLTVQLLKAHGCGVLGLDYKAPRLELAERFGAEVVDLSKAGEPMAEASRFSRGKGVDGVLITAATESNEPVRHAAVMCRKRGRIILVGVSGLELSRADFYEKELSFQVSCSYGPGRYDPDYEEGGQDYPYAFVRWTAQRNFEAVLEMMAEGRLKVAPLVSHRFTFERAREAYRLLTGRDPSLGILLQYPAETRLGEDLRQRTVQLAGERPRRRSARPRPVVGVIGAGGYATQTLLPALKDRGVRLKTLLSRGSAGAAHAAKRFGFEYSTTDIGALFSDGEIDAVVIATRHDSHAELTCAALEAGKHVFVEKPLAITREQLEAIVSAHETAAAGPSPPVLMVGFNRRFAPQIARMKALLEGVTEPKSLVMTVNAGGLPGGHWALDPAVGGGRIIGEGCHFVDLLRFLVGVRVESVQATRTYGTSAGGDDGASFTLCFADGSVGTVHYLTSGHRSFPKERIELYSAGRILQLENFRRMRGFGWPGFRRQTLRRQDKGNAACIGAFIESVREGHPSPIAFDDMAASTVTTFDVVEALGA